MKRLDNTLTQVFLTSCANIATFCDQIELKYYTKTLNVNKPETLVKQEVTKQYSDLVFKAENGSVDDEIIKSYLRAKGSVDLINKFINCSKNVEGYKNLIVLKDENINLIKTATSKQLTMAANVASMYTTKTELLTVSETLECYLALVNYGAIRIPFDYKSYTVNVRELNCIIKDTLLSGEIDKLTLLPTEVDSKTPEEILKIVEEIYAVQWRRDNEEGV